MKVFTTGSNAAHQMEKWVSGEVRVLFMMGLSGSGKTTLATKLAAEHGARIVSLDKYFRALPKATHEGEGAFDYTKACYQRGIEELLRDNPTGQLVVEGLWLGAFDLEKIKQHAVLVVASSYVLSTWRAIKRDFTHKHWKAYGLPRPYKHVRNNFIWWAQMKKFIAAL